MRLAENNNLIIFQNGLIQIRELGVKFSKREEKVEKKKKTQQ